MEQIKTNLCTTTEKVYVNEEGKEDLIIRKEHKMLKDNALSSDIKYIITTDNMKRINVNGDIVLTVTEANFILEALTELNKSDIIKEGEKLTEKGLLQKELTIAHKESHYLIQDTITGSYFNTDGIFDSSQDPEKFTKKEDAEKIIAAYKKMIDGMDSINPYYVLSDMGDEFIKNYHKNSLVKDTYDKGRYLRLVQEILETNRECIFYYRIYDDVEKEYFTTDGVFNKTGIPMTTTNKNTAHQKMIELYGSCLGRINRETGK